MYISICVCIYVGVKILASGLLAGVDFIPFLTKLFGSGHQKRCVARGQLLRIIILYPEQQSWITYING